MRGATGNVFVMTLLTRALIYAIAAMSLNLIMGYGGLVSFGHAMFIGIGGYAVGIMAFHGNANGLLQFPLAIVVSALFALIVGALSLRTRGVYFIMITLAFAQMVYFAGVGLEDYGADDGMPLKRRSTLGPIDLADRTQLYLVCLAVLLATVWLIGRIVNSRFGMVIRGAKSNETRMLALGFPVFRYRLAAFTIAGAIVRARRRADGQPGGVRQSGDDALGAVGRPDRDGRDRRHPVAVGAGLRRDRVHRRRAPAVGLAEGHLAAGVRADDRAAGAVRAQRAR